MANLNLVDFILKLFHDPGEAQQFIADPDQALRDAGLPNVSAEQVSAVAATAAPEVALGNGDPVAALQRAVADHHSLSTPFVSHRVSAPETKTDLLANEGQVLSPDTGVDIVDVVEGDPVQLGDPRYDGDFELGDNAGIGEEPAELDNDATINDPVGLSSEVGQSAEPGDDRDFGDFSADVFGTDIFGTDIAVDLSEPLQTTVETNSDVGIF